MGSETYGCLAMTGQPFKDNVLFQRPNQEWSIARCEKLGSSVLINVQRNGRFENVRGKKIAANRHYPYPRHNTIWGKGSFTNRYHTSNMHDVSDGMLKSKARCS